MTCDKKNSVCCKPLTVLGKKKLKGRNLVGQVTGNLSYRPKYFIYFQALKSGCWARLELVAMQTDAQTSTMRYRLLLNHLKKFWINLLYCHMNWLGTVNAYFFVIELYLLICMANGTWIRDLVNTNDAKMQECLQKPTWTAVWLLEMANGRYCY